jgi:hypothetical protein
MAKTFTDKPLHQFDQVKTDNITANLDKYLDEFNGGLDSNNMPVERITQDHIKLPTNPGATGGPVIKNSIIFETQAYHETYRTYNQSGGASDIYDPVLVVDPDSDFWSAGFNRLAELDTAGGFDNFPLQFDAKEGMLIGCAVVDWEHGNDVYDVTAGPRGRGNGWWTELQVYVNNVGVVRTGRIYPRRHTTQIPFAVPCGSQPIQIDVRVKLNNWFVAGAPSLQGHATEFKVFSARIWCRNQYR